MAIKNIVFDVGKVLVYWEPDWIMNELGFDEETREAVAEAMFEHPLWNEVDLAVMSSEELIQAFIKNAPMYANEIRKAYMHMGTAIELFPHTMRWIEELKERGFHLYIISNYGEYTFEVTKDKMEFLPYMDGTIFSYRYHIMKPDARIFEQLLKEYDLKAEECVFIDDRAENVEGARKVGYKGIVFTTYDEAKEKLEEMIS